MDIKFSLPSPYMVFSQSLSVNSLQWRIWGEGADHVTRRALAVRNNEAWGLDKNLAMSLSDVTTLIKHLFLLWKVWTQELFHKKFEYYRPVERSPE